MKAFLEYVAEDIIRKYGTNLSKIVVVFPNKRASLFMNEYLVRVAGKPIWAPTYITISELFRRHSKLMEGDQIKLICDLHKTFTACTKIDETLDHFYGWGQLLLADFDDLDKNMADAHQVFANLKNIHEFDDVSYLTDNQKKALQKFFNNFNEDHNSELKQRFLSLWSNFETIYHDYNLCLECQGLAYEGALYRKVVLDKDIVFEYDTYIFVGFNMMQKAELTICDRLMKEGKARFYWDFDRYFMPKSPAHNTHEASHFVSQYLSRYPNELDVTDGAIYDNLNRKQEITYLSATTEDAQARYISRWLQDEKRVQAGRKTAIVLADEGLLQTVIHCLPDTIKNVNITTGYPLTLSPVSSFINTLIQLQTVGHVSNTDKFRLRNVSAVLRHPYAVFVSENCVDLLKNLQENRRYYPSIRELATDDNLAFLFKDISRLDGDRNLQLANWMIELLRRIGIRAKEDYDPLFKESLFRMYTLLNRLAGLIENGDLTVDGVTFQRLISQLIQSTSIPFHGEPAIGLQIMGVLETRNLDFDHILVLSCNEGNMPKGVNDASFIPYSIRKAFGLTTIDNKVAIYAYYFYSLLQRSSDITLAYNTAAEDGKTGEMSRFMLQLMIESEFNIKYVMLRAGQKVVMPHRTPIEKTDEIITILNSFTKISPTAINRYLRCQLQFYYNMVLGIKEPDEDEGGEIDNRIFGNIFHRSAELAYLHFASKEEIEEADGKLKLIRPLQIHKEDLDALLNNKAVIAEIVDRAFAEELFKLKEKHASIEYNGLQIINREVIIGYLRQLLEIDRRLVPFTIKALEQDVYATIEFPVLGESRVLKIGGYIDRLDEVKRDETGRYIRVIDYKTGNTPSKTTNTIEDVFSTDDISLRHTDYFLQSILYSIIVRHSEQWNDRRLPVSPALLFIQHSMGENYDPVLKLGKEKINDVEEYYEEFKERLKNVLREIFDPKTDFSLTPDTKRCNACPYNRLCGI
ncbi:PD-(D/E)XK nuclease family protein [Hoylesella oralis]|uniref:PD-(D/E)XK nuclease family protein n=1 Tax=Hoylesella oralis TaxID=28134 RepID=UPI0028E68819|nr:PD-(D/E)XK nuclease family protein [Hoylesella oralis]